MYSKKWLVSWCVWDNYSSTRGRVKWHDSKLSCVWFIAIQKFLWSKLLGYTTYYAISLLGLEPQLSLRDSKKTKKVFRKGPPVLLKIVITYTTARFPTSVQLWVYGRMGAWYYELPNVVGVARSSTRQTSRNRGNESESESERASEKVRKTYNWKYKTQRCNAKKKWRIYAHDPVSSVHHGGWALLPPPCHRPAVHVQESIQLLLSLIPRPFRSAYARMTCCWQYLTRSVNLEESQPVFKVRKA